MSHYTHPKELEPEIARQALQRIIDTGAVVRCQSPIACHINDSAEAWAELWRTEVSLGAVPYYMFIPRDTGAQKYYEIPLARALEIFNEALSHVSGLGRTVRGPSASIVPGKVLIDGVADKNSEKVFVMKFAQARDPSWVGKAFYAKFDPDATWPDQLKPAFGEKEFFYEQPMRELLKKAKSQQK